MFDALASRGDPRAAQPAVRRHVLARQPDPRQDRPEPPGHDVGGLRLPRVEADESELAIIRGALERQGLLNPVHAA